MLQRERLNQVWGDFLIAVIEADDGVCVCGGVLTLAHSSEGTVPQGRQSVAESTQPGRILQAES